MSLNYIDQSRRTRAAVIAAMFIASLVAQGFGWL